MRKTTERVAEAASKVLRDSKTSKSAKTAAGSALTQNYRVIFYKSDFAKEIGKDMGKSKSGDYRIVVHSAATAASKVLRSPGNSKSAKTSAGSALSQSRKK